MAPTHRWRGPQAHPFVKCDQERTMCGIGADCVGKLLALPPSPLLPLLFFFQHFPHSFRHSISV